MDHAKALSIISEIEELVETNSLARQQWHSLIRSACRYAQIRITWYLAEEQERAEMDRRRTIAHNALIDDCDILSRVFASEGLNNGWRGELGEDRREIGDFACHLHALLGLRAR